MWNDRHAEGIELFPKNADTPAEKLADLDADELCIDAIADQDAEELDALDNEPREAGNKPANQAETAASLKTKTRCADAAEDFIDPANFDGLDQQAASAFDPDVLAARPTGQLDTQTAASQRAWGAGRAVRAPLAPHSPGTLAEWQQHRCCICGSPRPVHGFGPPLSRTFIWACDEHHEQVDRTFTAGRNPVRDPGGDTAYGLLCQLCVKFGARHSDVPDQGLTVHIDRWREAVMEEMWVGDKQDAQEDAFQRVCSALRNAGRVGMAGDLVWAIPVEIP